MDRARFDVYWSKLRELWKAYPGQNDSVVKSIYFKRLARFKTEAVESAMAACLDQCHRFPTIAQIVEKIPAGSIDDIVGAKMEDMNAAIRAKQVQDRKVYRVVWLADEAGCLRGYKLELPEEDEKHGRYKDGSKNPH